MTDESTEGLITRTQSLAELERNAACEGFLHGHENLLRVRSNGSFSFTFVRNPFSRLLSERRQWMQATQENLDAAPEAIRAATVQLKDRRISEILERAYEFPIIVPSFWNHQTFALGGWPLIRTSSRSDDARDYRYYNLYRHFPDSRALCTWLERSRYAILKTARGTLRSLDYIGIYEDFENSAREVFALLGLPEPETIPHLNAREQFADENDDGLKEHARPFIDLDEELYDEACELQARHGRAVRGAPIDYIGRSVAADEDKIFTAFEPPGGHGWHEHALRGDGKWSRWTGPSTTSYFTVRLAPGHYRLELFIFGAASEEAIRTAGLSAGGIALDTAVTSLPDGRWTASAEFHSETAQRYEFCVSVPCARQNHGLEIEAFRIAGCSGAVRNNSATSEPRSDIDM